MSRALRFSLLLGLAAATTAGCGDDDRSSSGDDGGTPADGAVGMEDADPPGASCGDGVVDGEEECDGTDLAGESCGSRGFDSGTLVCTPDCKLDTAGCERAPGCGDDEVGEDEVCDGEDLGGATCESEGFAAGTLACNDACDGFDTSGCTDGAMCGDGEVTGDEACDGSDLNGQSCESQGFVSGELACNDACDGFDTNACSTCGNGELNAGEVCDGSALEGRTCTDEGFAGGTLACNDSCNGYDTSACDNCGNGTLDEGEACDGIDFGDATCGSAGFGGGSLSCTDSCELDTSACDPCGNGVIDEGETCDGTALGDQACSDRGYAGGTLACNDSCNGFDESACTNCGNGEIDAGETCDGAALGDATCESEEFDRGTLACNDSCNGFDTSMCEVDTCGNGELDEGEDCDGANLQGATCESSGDFVGGTLACTSTCKLDTSMCETCGNGEVDEGELCDGSNLGGTTCESVEGGGFGGGTLACNATCDGFDTSACDLCGNGVRDPDEMCDGEDFGDLTCMEAGFGSGTLSCTDSCTIDTSACDPCGNGQLDEGEACDGDILAGQTCADLDFDRGTLACNDSCTDFDTSACMDIVAPPVGAVFINEIMQNPDSLGDTDGEWFEIHNPGSTPWTLEGCRIEGAEDAGFSFGSDTTGSLRIESGAYVTFARSGEAELGFEPNIVYPNGFALVNGAGRLALYCPGLGGDESLVDEVVWDDGASFPDPTGASMSLDPDHQLTNDVGAYWCEGTGDWGIGDRGTPGEANGQCAEWSIASCRVQSPAEIAAAEGTPVTVYGRVSAPGLTDLSTGVDTHPRFLAELGYGADGSDPAADGWTWTGAEANGAYGEGSPAFDAAEDEYQASFDVPAADGSPYDYAYRFSGDGGATWTYCDTAGNGPFTPYDAANAGSLVVEDGGAPALFFTEYVEGSGNDKALEIYNAGSTSVDLAAADCEYRVYSNDNTFFSAYELGGVVGPGEAFVTCAGMASEPLLSFCDENRYTGLFNGNDAIELACGDEVLDIIGHIGNDAGWGENVILRRMCSVTAGDTDGSDAFDRSEEWDVVSLDSEMPFADLGNRSCD